MPEPLVETITITLTGPADLPRGAWAAYTDVFRVDLEDNLTEFAAMTYANAGCEDIEGLITMEVT